MQQEVPVQTGEHQGNLEGNKGALCPSSSERNIPEDTGFMDRRTS